MANKIPTSEEIVKRNQAAMGKDHPRLVKAKERIAELEEQLSQASMSVLNMRQMYEGSVQEKTYLQQQNQNLQQMLTAVVAQARGKSVTIKEKTIAGLDKWVGLNSTEKDGDLTLVVLTEADVTAMEEEE